MSDNPNEYKVGYGRPPKHTQFREGQSGNPNGRPKGARNLKTDLAAELNKRIDIREGDQRRRISKQEALIKRLIEQGLNGDPRALAAALNLMIRAFGLEDAERAGSALAVDDQEILAAYLNQASQSGAADASKLKGETVNEDGGGVGDVQTADDRARDKHIAG
jgi:hypothetical protein